MIGLDTNVLVRYIMQDDPKQSPKANKVIEALTPEEPGFLSMVSVVELGWVLSSCYKLTRDQQAQAFEALLQIKEILVDHADQVARAVRMFKGSSADLADCLIERTAAAAGCACTMTFDVGASRVAGMTHIV